MNCVLWSMGDASLHGIGTSSVPASLSGVTHVAGLNCYLCVRTVPRRRLTNACSRPTSQSSNLHAQICRLSGGRLMRGVDMTSAAKGHGDVGIMRVGNPGGHGGCSSHR